jgi:hypothetical protein
MAVDLSAKCNVTESMSILVHVDQFTCNFVNSNLEDAARKASSRACWDPERSWALASAAKTVGCKWEKEQATHQKQVHQSRLDQLSNP